MQPEQYEYTNYQQPADTNRAKRIIMIVLAVTLVVSVVLIIVVLLTSKPGLRQELGAAAAANQEVSRVAELGLDSNSLSGGIANKTSIISIISKENVIQLSAIIDEDHGSPITDLTLLSANNPNADDILIKAGQNNSYNEEFIEVITALLQQANGQSEIVLDKATDEKLRSVLKTQITQNTLLIEDLAL